MSLFGDVKYGDFLNENANYRVCDMLPNIVLHFMLPKLMIGLLHMIFNVNRVS
jgi:hypothetical protein